MEHSLTQLSLVDSPLTEDFDRFTRLATKMLGVPVALISIVDFDKDRQFFTSACGLGEPWASQRQTPMTHSFCQHVVTDGEPLVIEDARTHPLVRDNLAIRDLNVIAYLGIPVTNPNGKALGALCAIDTQPRAWSKDDISVLADLAMLVTKEIGMRTTELERDAVLSATIRMGKIVENSTHEVFIVDAETLKFVNVNKGARTNLGYNLADLQNLTPLDINPEFELHEIKALVRPLKEGRTDNLAFETTHKRKDGTTYPASMRLEHHSDATGSVFIAFCEDISKRLALERSLRMESENFLALFNNAPDPMTIAETDTTLLAANPSYERVLDCNAADLIGTRFIDHVPAEDQGLVIQNLSNATPESPFSSILQQQKVNGKIRSIVWTNITQFVDGKSQKIFSIANDVTELYEAKNQAENSANEAKKAMEIRKLFLANMSHEVRTPLNAIMGLFQLIQMADVPERQKRQAEVGLNASHHLLAQLVNVLELSRVEANAVEITLKPTDIRSLAEQWLETASATNHRLGKPIELSLEIDETTPELALLDERRVTQILNNLTDNALKFTREGRVTIQVGQVSNTDVSAPQQLEISVSDTGCGIARNQREAVFERFVQIDDAETRENSGSGLGLAISRELAILMGGTLNVTCRSPDDCYATTFSLRLNFSK